MQGRRNHGKSWDPATIDLPDAKRWRNRASRLGRSGLSSAPTRICWPKAQEFAWAAVRLVRIDPRASFELITRICELIFRRKLRPSFPAQIAGSRCKVINRVLVITAGSAGVMRIGRQRPFTASLPGFLKDVRTEVMPY